MMSALSFAAYLVGEAGIKPWTKTTDEEAELIASTPASTSEDATVVTEISEIVPSAAFGTRFALARVALDGSAGFGEP